MGYAHKHQGPSEHRGAPRVVRVSGLFEKECIYRKHDLQYHQSDNDGIGTHHVRELLSAPGHLPKASALCFRTKFLSIYSFHETTADACACPVGTRHRGLEAVAYVINCPSDAGDIIIH